MIQKAKHATAWACTAAGALIVIFILLQKLGPTIEARAAPLFTDVVATFVVVKNDHTDILVTGTKARNCMMAAAKADVFVDTNQISAKAIMLTQAGEELPLEQQRTSKGDKFVRLVRVTPAATVLAVKVYSRCHPLWLSEQELFKLDISKFPAQVR